MASVSGVRRLPKSGFRTTVREPDGHIEVSASGQEAGGGISVCRSAPGASHPGGWHPLRPQRYHGAAGPGRIKPPGVLTPIFLDAPGQFGDSAAAGERSGVKNPSRAGLRVEEDVRTRIPSAPAPLRHRDPAPEAPPSRTPTARVALPYPIPANRPRRYTLLGEASRFAFTVPENLRPSTRHRNLHRPTHTDINKTASQQNYTTTQQHNNKTKQLGNRRP